jgi:hypothetical protein
VSGLFFRNRVSSRGGDGIVRSDDATLVEPRLLLPRNSQSKSTGQVAASADRLTHLRTDFPKFELRLAPPVHSEVGRQMKKFLLASAAVIAIARVNYRFGS